MKYERVCLVHSPLDLSATQIPSVGSLAPLGLISLATYLNRNSHAHVTVVDGDLMGLEKTKKELRDYDLVGIGVQAGESYQSALELSETAKENGSVVVMGGEQATIRAEQILANRPYIDFVVRGQGESGLLSLVNGEILENISGLTYRSGKDVISNPSQRLSLRNLPIPDRTFVNQRDYEEQFQKTLESKLIGLRSFATVRTQDGCMKAIKQGVCTFCVRDDLLVFRLRNPEQFWEEMLYLKSLGIDYVWDISPSFSSVPLKYLQSLVKTKPAESEMRFRVYARADDLAEEDKVRALKGIGIENVLVGFDSGNQDCLDSSNKGTTLEQHRAAAENLRRHGISTYAAFVLGHLAETYDSMQDTLNHARELRDIMGDELYRTVTCSKMQLYPGSGEWNAFLSANPDLREKYEGADVINLKELSELYFRKHLGINPEEADKTAEEIRALAPIKSGKDMRKMVHG